MAAVFRSNIIHRYKGVQFRTKYYTPTSVAIVPILAAEAAMLSPDVQFLGGIQTELATRFKTTIPMAFSQGTATGLGMPALNLVTIHFLPQNVPDATAIGHGFRGLILTELSEDGTFPLISDGDTDEDQQPGEDGSDELVPATGGSTWGGTVDDYATAVVANSSDRAGNALTKYTYAKVNAKHTKVSV